MQAEAVMANLSDLSKLSEQLNEKSNQVNKILQDLESKLVTMNLGVEAWLYNKPLTSRPYTVYNDRTDLEAQYTEDQVLGFGRYSDRFRLLVKKVTYGAKGVDNYGNTNWVVEDEEDVKPLLEAPRDLRVKALPMIEALLDALALEAKRVIDSIKNGKDIVDKL